METAAIKRLLTRLKIGKVVKLSVIEAYHTFQDKRQYFSRARRFVFESTKSRFSRFAEIRLSQTTVTQVGANKVKYHLEVDTPAQYFTAFYFSVFTSLLLVVLSCE